MHNYSRFSGNNPFGSQAKLLLHFPELYEYLANGDTSCPIFMEVGLTNKCNMSCTWCITENGRDNKNGVCIDINKLEDYMKDFSDMGGKAITFCGQGEPTLYPYFEEAVLFAKKCGLKLGLMTNGVYRDKYNYLIGQNFEWIRISLDTLDPKKYREWKGIDGVSTIIRNVVSLSDYSVKIGINCNVGKNMTINQVKQLIEWIDNNDSIAYLQFRPILPRVYKDEKPETNIDVWDYLDFHILSRKINLSDDKRLDIQNGTAFDFRSCEGHFFEPILDANGDVKICTYHPLDQRLSFGNINQSSFRDIWASDRRQHAINFIRSFDYKTKCQMCCKLAEPNKLVDFLTHPEEYNDLHFL
jgi:MoaA/NifB/PqqE/SkfB family radical SAM enzyme